MSNIVERLQQAAKFGGHYAEAADEIERLRGVIDCGCNAIRDAVVFGGGDIKRIDAAQRRMRREISICIAKAALDGDA